MKDTIQLVIMITLITAIGIGVTAAIMIALYTSQTSDEGDCAKAGLSKIVLLSS